MKLFIVVGSIHPKQILTAAHCFYKDSTYIDLESPINFCQKVFEITVNTIIYICFYVLYCVKKNQIAQTLQLKIYKRHF